MEKTENVFKIKNMIMDQKRIGDCFFVHIKRQNDECVILVDSYDGKTKEFIEKLKTQIKEYQKIHCIVITHCDYDHIGGILKLLQENDEGIRNILQDAIVIFNNVKKEDGTIHYGHAIQLNSLLRKENMSVIPSYCITGKSDISNGILHIKYSDKRKRFSESLIRAQKTEPYLTILHPDLDGIKEVYNNYCLTKKKITAKSEKAEEDITNAEWNYYNNGAKIINRNSIAFLLEYADKKVLFCGDGYMNILNDKVKAILGDDSKIDLIKMAHHGAKDNNVGLKDLAEKYKCNTFIVTGEYDWAKEKKHPAQVIIKELEGADLGGALKIYTKIDMSAYGNPEIFSSYDEIDIIKE